MNWSIRYASERQWYNVKKLKFNYFPVEKLDKYDESTRKYKEDWEKWQSIVLPGVPSGHTIRGFTGEIRLRGGGGSTYKLENDGTWTKTLSPEAQELYKTTRPGMYKNLDSQGRYTENWEHTVFIHPYHTLAIAEMAEQRGAHQKQEDGSFKYIGYGLTRGLPKSQISIEGDSEGHDGNYIIPANHISSTPFPWAIPYQHGRCIFGNGKSYEGWHVGNAVGDVYE